MHITKNKKISSFQEVKNLSFLRFWAHFGRPKVMKNRGFSQQEKHPNRMVCAANLSIEGGQEPIKMEATKVRK